MTLCGIWVKADNGRWFDDPEIGGADWRLEIDEFSDDHLFIRSKKDPKGERVPVIEPGELLRVTHLPIKFKTTGCRGFHGDIGACILYVVMTTGKPFPRLVIRHKGDGHEQPGREGTRVGTTNGS